MIAVENEHEPGTVGRVSEFTAAACALAWEMVKPGTDPRQIDKAAREFIAVWGAQPSLLNFGSSPSWGFHGDCAVTEARGTAFRGSPDPAGRSGRRFSGSSSFVISGQEMSDISRAIETYVESNGYSVRFSCVSHGAEDRLHVVPEALNPGMTGQEPEGISRKSAALRQHCPGDRKRSAHYENTVLITDGEPEILTVKEGL